MLKKNECYTIPSNPSFIKRVWVNARFALISFLLLFFLIGGLKLSAPSFVILIALLIAVYYLKKDANVYVISITTNNTNLNIQYYLKNELMRLEIPLSNATIQKNHKRAKYKGYYTLDIFDENKLVLSQHQFLDWNETGMNRVVELFSEEN